MIYPDVSVKIWKSQFNIETPKSVKCEGCGKKMRFTVPVAYGEYRGLKTPAHGCSEDCDQYVDVPVNSNEVNQLKVLASLYNSKAPPTGHR